MHRSQSLATHLALRYFACESFYNIAKVCKGEILTFFNEIFDALSKLAADSEVSVKNGAELLDRLLKDVSRLKRIPRMLAHVIECHPPSL